MSKRAVDIYGIQQWLLLATIAANVDSPLASLSLGGISALDDVAPGFDVSSEDAAPAGSEQISVGEGGVGATVSLVDYALESGADRAEAQLGALGVDLTTPLPLGLSLDAQEVGAAARPTESASAVDLGISGLELGVGDLLPQQVLDALPLSALLDLQRSLGVPLPTELASDVAALDALPGVLQGAVDTAALLSAAQDQLSAAIAADPTLASLQDAVESASGALAAANAELAAVQASISALESELAGLDSILDALRILEIGDELDSLDAQETAAQSAVTAAEAALSAARAALDAALAEVASLSPALAALVAQVQELTDLLDGLLAQLDGLLAQLDGILAGLDLDQLRLDLLGVLDDTPLLSAGGIGLVLATVADATGGIGTATCRVEELRVAGLAVPGASRAELSTALGTVAGLVGDVLGALPLSAPLPAITVAGLQPSASGTTAPDAAGVSEASAAITALVLDVASVDLTATVDDLVGQLGALAAQLDDQLDGVAAQLGGLPVGLEGALTELQTVIDGLPLGDALEGLSTVGISSSSGTVVLGSGFAPARSPVAPASPASPTTPATPSTPSSPSLPSTGGDGERFLLAGLAALAVLAVALRLGRAVEANLARVDRP